MTTPLNGRYSGDFGRVYIHFQGFPSENHSETGSRGLGSRSQDSGGDCGERVSKA